jgi:NADPH:quinone reductase-like Zn-dependent oxidoreductase
MTTPRTHKAVVTPSPRAPLQLISVPTPTPKPNEIKVRGEWTASTPLDLHQADGGLLVSHPQVLGDGLVGTVVEVGVEVSRFKVGERVFGFTWRGRRLIRSLRWARRCFGGRFVCLVFFPVLSSPTEREGIGKCISILIRYAEGS